MKPEAPPAALAQVGVVHGPRKVKMLELFPVYLDVTGRSCLVVGGGEVACRKVRNLLECGASITVVAPEAEEGIRQLARNREVTWYDREFVETDLEGMFLVFSATNQEGLNEVIAELCKKRNILVNVVDDPPRCTFLVPSVVRRGPLSVAISTGGNSPLFARKLREQLEQIITREHGEFVELLGQAREMAKRAYPDDMARRRKVFEALVDSDILELLFKGEKDRAKERIEQCIFSLPD